MTESRYPGLDQQANGEHRDSFTTRYAEPTGYDSGATQAAGPGGNGPAGPPPVRTGPDSGSSHSISPDDLKGLDLSQIGGTSTYGGKPGGRPPAASAAPPAPAAAPPPPAPPKPSGGPSGSGLSGSGLSGSGYGGSSYGGGSGMSNGSSYGSTGYGTSSYGSVTGYDPANYPPPTPYGSDGPDGSTYRVGRDGTIKKLGVDTQTNLPPVGGPPPAPRGSVRTALSNAAGRSGPRRARLQLKHIDPWTTMKFTLVLSVAMFVVWMIAVGLLYGVLGGLGVWNQVNDLYDQVAGGNLITAKFVLTSAAVVGVINIVLFTALATIGSFVYNLCSDLVGGIELTLSERD